MESMNNNAPSLNKKKLKKLYTKIRTQMEFYFSDSNLVKDKFLSDLISKDPDGFVDIEIFKRFNKIKALTDKTEMIASSVSRSSLFELNEDQTKLKRITPLELSKDYDACTLYAEKLPPNADQKWVKDVFGQFGTIRYVNVPRYNITNKIKGFTFVEFDNPDSVQKACEFYKVANEKESLTSEDECKPAKNAKKHKQEEISDKKHKRKKIRSASESSEKISDISSLKSDLQTEALEKDYDSSGHHYQKSKRKRKREYSGGEESLKKLKELPIDDNVNAKCDNIVVRKQIVEEKKTSLPEQEQYMEHESLEKSDNEHNVTDTGVKAKKRRKNSKKHHSSIVKPLLRVMPKTEWKAFRNKYLELQRSTMSLLKKQILLQTQEFKEHDNSTKSAETLEHKKFLQFQPGVILKVELAEPVKNTAGIKNEVKANAVVAYIDAPEQSSKIFIRCHTPEEAQVIIKEDKLNHLGKTQLLEDDEEKKYWEKIENDRKLKFSNPVPHKKRGREKLLAKAAKLEEMKNKHIYFDE